MAMGFPEFEPLPEVTGADGLRLSKLPTLFTPFSVPFLEEKPQNPIIQRLQVRTTPPHPRDVLPKELLLLSEQLTENGGLSEEGELYDFWEEAARSERPSKGHIASWDTLRANDGRYLNEDSNSPFLSEQSVHVVSAARFHARPPLLNKTHRVRHVSSAELIQNLSAILLGCSSTIYIWDNSTQRFVMQKSSEEEEAYIFLDGMDEVVSKSYIKRFLEIGTHLRRLELLALHLRNIILPPSHNPATTYAFAHALSAVTVHMQNEMTKRLLDIRKRGTSRLADFWLNFENMQNAIGSIAKLCGRDSHLDAQAFPVLPHNSPSDLLSHIYRHLSDAQKLCGTRSSLAFGLLAYIITITSKPYLAHIAEEVGLEHGVMSSAQTKTTRTFQPHNDELAPGEEEESNGSNCDDDALDAHEQSSFPGFISSVIGEAIIRAKRSIHILHVAETSLWEDPRSTQESIKRRRLQWRWSEAELLQSDEEDACPLHLSNDYLAVHSEVEVSEVVPPNTRSYPTEIAKAFAAFDLEPGSHLVSATTAKQTEGQRVEAFLSRFPQSLPSITPTLPILAERILNPIVLQANALSRASLRIFFGDDPRNGGGGELLHFRSHVILLRSYLLTMGSSFRERLQNAIFSDKSPGEELDERSRAGLAKEARRQTRHPDVKQDSYPSPTWPWVVGLARGLMVNSQGEHQDWPPGGSDLSFFLRNVIMNSLEQVKNAEFSHLSTNDVSKLHEESSSYSDDNGFWDDVEARMGFAIRDLPTGSGTTKDKWMDPNSIEALDFLFMDYKPPRPLRTLISKEILSKYQRMFTFLIRLMRVQSAVRAVHRVARHSELRLFATNKPSRQLFEYFLFAAHGFLSALSSYVSNTAISGNIDAFLARVAAAESQSRSQSENEASENEHFEPLMFEDVHALADAHSKMLNDILSACLQRASQHAYGDLLTSCLEVLLEFCTLIGDLVSRRIDESETAAKLRVLWERWRGKVSVLAKALHKLADKGVASVHVSSVSHSALGIDGAPEKSLPVPAGGVEALADLLIRLDFSDWWKNLPLSK
ncbi:hypothetical protein SCHPADRAFT_846666 [Schizopora paradoxa]|uniref:Spindle pole body component n=1 Tax=Schizopora paradoxa TaxID=27342 RepID=A0A0H2S735_9AGAM|nr:hypothetical protein SCHPADRAFT_846666 [Schizopora paradoxa]